MSDESFNERKNSWKEKRIDSLIRLSFEQSYSVEKEFLLFVTAAGGVPDDAAWAAGTRLYGELSEATCTLAWSYGGPPGVYARTLAAMWKAYDAAAPFTMFQYLLALYEVYVNAEWDDLIDAPTDSNGRFLDGYGIGLNKARWRMILEPLRADIEVHPPELLAAWAEFWAGTIPSVADTLLSARADGTPLGMVTEAADGMTTTRGSDVLDVLLSSARLYPALTRTVLVDLGGAQLRIDAKGGKARMTYAEGSRVTVARGAVPVAEVLRFDFGSVLLVLPHDMLYLDAPVSQTLAAKIKKYTILEAK